MPEEEKKNMFIELELLRKKNLSNEKKKENTYSERQSKIEEAKEKITQEYNERIDKLHEQTVLSKKDLIDYASLISRYSTFDTKLIGQILEQLVSMVECEKYSYQEATHDSKGIEHTVMDRVEVSIHNQVKLIAKGEKQTAQYRSSSVYDSPITRLVKDGNAILLLEDEPYHMRGNNIGFYRAIDGKISSPVNFGRFDYVKVFIDKIIQYRYQNSLEQITEKELLSFMSDFVSSNRDLIANNYQLRITEKQEQMQKELDEAQRKLDEYNKKINRPKRPIPDTKLIDRIGNALDITEQKFPELLTPLELSFMEVLTSVGYNYEDGTGKVSALLGESLISTEFTQISKVALSGEVDYWDNQYGSSMAKINDEGIIGVFDVSNRLCDDVKELNNFEWYLGSIIIPNQGRITKLINGEYLVVLLSPSHFYSSQYIDSLNETKKEKYEYTEEIERLSDYGLSVEELCGTLNEELLQYRNNKSVKKLKTLK